MSSRWVSAHVTRRSLVKGIGLMSGAVALSACTAQQGTDGASDGTPEAAAPLLAIIHTNDTHGHDVEVATTEDASGNFSMAAVPALRQEWEQRGYEVILVDAGDATQGMPLVDTTDGMATIAFMNGCGYDLMTLGNHEFAHGAEGIAFTVDRTVPFEEGTTYPDSLITRPAAPGARVNITDVGGRGFDEGESYVVVANAFLCAGGDRYDVLKEDAEPRSRRVPATTTRRS